METLQKNSLFWDVDKKKLDPEISKEFIVRRILDRGDLEDLHWAEKFYGKKNLKKIFCQFQNKFDKKSINFWQFYFNLDNSICTQKPLIKKLSAFFLR